MRKNLLFTFIVSFCPGAGQMYQNYMKRGLSLMSIAAICIVFLALDIGIFITPLIVIFIYSFFDSFRLRNLTDKERETYIDDYIWSNSSFFASLPNTINIKKNKFFGLLLIAFGTYVLIISILGQFINIEIIYKLYNFIIRYLPTMFVAVISIYLGIKMIKK